MALPSLTKPNSTPPAVKIDPDLVAQRAEQKLSGSDRNLHPTAQLIQDSREPAAVRINPKKVKWSPWANRTEENFVGTEFDEFVEDIRRTGGNTQAAKVRPLAVPEGEYEYELACGHRRHRACSVAGTPFLAIIKNMTNRELQRELETENRGRKDPAAWERACQYASQLADYDSVEHMANEMNIAAATMYKYLRITKMPKEVLALIDKKLSIGLEEAHSFISWMEKDGNEAIYVDNLSKLQQAKFQGKAKDVFAALKKKEVVKPTGKPVEILDKAGNSIATVSINRAKQLRLVVENATPELMKKVEEFIQKNVK